MDILRLKGLVCVEGSSGKSGNIWFVIQAVHEIYDKHEVPVGGNSHSGDSSNKNNRFIFIGRCLDCNVLKESLKECFIKEL